MTYARLLDCAGTAPKCGAVSRRLKVIALFLAAFWLPATVHCQLESLGLGALFACADQSGQAAHEDSAGCTDNGCQTVESGQIALAKSNLNLSLLPACACVPSFQYLVRPAPAPEISARGQEGTLPLQRTWQFVRRAALPARAPDSLNG